MRFAKTVTALALACSLALAIPTFAAPAAEEQAGRQEDLELLYQTIRDRHPGPFTNTPEQEFLARIAQIEARIDTEDSMSFGLDLQSLAALIGDSHTTTNLNSILSSGHMFPVSVKWMDGDWVLYQVDASHQGALGQQVTSVNGFSMDQVQEKMAPLISADNEIKLRRQLSQVFGHQEIMVYCGLLKPEEDLTLTLENGTSITLSPLSMQDQSGWPEINGLSQQRQGSAPTDYQKGTYYFSLPLDSRTYYIQYNQCMEDPELPMETFTAQVHGRPGARELFRPGAFGSAEQRRRLRRGHHPPADGAGPPGPQRGAGAVGAGGGGHLLLRQHQRPGDPGDGRRAGR